MTREPVSVSPEDTVQRAAQLMDELNVGALPVCDGERRVLGIVTDRDIAVRAIAVGLMPMVTPVEVVMSRHVRCTWRSQSAGEALAQMAAVQIRRMPVLDDAERLVGIVSLGDLAERHRDGGVEEALRRISTPSAPDRDDVRG